MSENLLTQFLSESLETKLSEQLETGKIFFFPIRVMNDEPGETPVPTTLQLQQIFRFRASLPTQKNLIERETQTNKGGICRVSIGTETQLLTLNDVFNLTILFHLVKNLPTHGFVPCECQ
jgi:hypothetical protein